MGKAKVERAVKVAKAVKMWRPFKTTLVFHDYEGWHFEQPESVPDLDRCEVWISRTKPRAKPKPSPSPVTPKAAGKVRYYAWGVHPTWYCSINRGVVRVFANTYPHGAETPVTAKEIQGDKEGFPPRTIRQVRAIRAVWRKGRGK